MNYFVKESGRKVSVKCNLKKALISRNQMLKIKGGTGESGNIIIIEDMINA